MKKLSIPLSIFTILTLLLLPINLDAISTFEATQTNSARTSLDLEGGYIEDIAIAPNGTIYAACNSPNGIFSSTDSGTTWRGPSGKADLGTIADVETDSSSNAYIIGGIDLYKSTNGTSWTKLTAGRGNYGQTILYAQNKLLAPIRDGSIDISTNGGTSFTNSGVIASGSGIISIASSPTAGTFYALLDNGTTKTLYQSTDGGSLWSSTGKTGNYSVVGVDPNNASHIVLAGGEYSYTLNGGGAWSSMLNSPNGSGHVTFRSSDSRLYIGNTYSDDLGTTAWHNLESEATSYTSILKGDSFAINPSNTNIMFIKSGRGIARTTDGGANWVDIYNGMNGVTVNDISQAADKNIVWIAAQGGLAKTANFTSASPSWAYPILPTLSVDYMTAVWVNPANPNIVLGGGLGQFYRSTNGGSSWNNLGVALVGNIKDIKATSDNGIIYAGYGGSSGGGVLKSTDGGATWTDTGLSGAPVNAIAIGSDGSVYAGCGREFDSTATTRGIYKYNGTSWSKLSGAPATYLINDLLVVGSTIYAAGGETEKGGVFKSTNGGSTWAELTKGLPSDGWFKALAREASSSTLYVSTSRPAGTSYIYKSMDNGASWGLYYTGLKDEAFNTMLYDALVGGSDTGLYNYKSKASLALTKRRGYAKLGQKLKTKVTLKDKATKKALRNRLVRIYKKVRVRKKRKLKWVWKLVARKKTNRQGYFNTYIRPRTRTSYYKAKWIVSGRKDKNNYLTATSGVLVVKAR